MKPRAMSFRMSTMSAYTPDEARAFCGRWLPAWSGNDPERLAMFYTEDVFYSDPSIPDGVRGQDAFVRYMTRLLGNNPKWIWRHEHGVPLLHGFLNYWRADIPVGDETIVCRGVCSVQLRDGLIYRNQVYFDTHALLGAIENWNTRRR